MELSVALRTTGAVREFESSPVPDEVIFRILDTARFAPNGGNRQAWRVVVVKDPAIRRTLRDIYLPGWYEYLAQVKAGLTPWAAVTDNERERQATAEAPEIATAAAAAPGGGGGAGPRAPETPTDPTPTRAGGGVRQCGPVRRPTVRAAMKVRIGVGVGALSLPDHHGFADRKSTR